MSQRAAASIDEAIGDEASPSTETALNLSVVVYNLTSIEEGQPQYDSVQSSYEVKPGIPNAVTIGFGDEYGINLEKPTDEQRSWLAEGVELEDGSSDNKRDGGNQGYGSLVFCECQGLTYVPRSKKKGRRVSLERSGQVDLIKVMMQQVQTGDTLRIAPTQFNDFPLYAIEIAEVNQA